MLRCMARWNTLSIMLLLRLQVQAGYDQQILASKEDSVLVNRREKRRPMLIGAQGA